MLQITLLLCVLSCSVVFISTENQNDENAALVAKTAKSLEIVDGTISNIVESLSKMDVGSMFAKLSKGLSMLGPVFMAVSTILSVVSIFVPQEESPEMKALRKGFEKVNSRLDGLKGAIAEIKLIAEISGAKSGLSHAFDAIDVMEVEMLIAQKRGSHQAWHYFTKRFEREYQHAADSIYLALSKSEWDADFRFDILEMFRQKFKCSPIALTRVCLIGMQSINRGIAIEAGYLGAIKYPSRVKKLRKEWHRRLEILRKRCGEMINDCETRWEEYASNVFVDYYDQNVHSQDPAKFANGLQQSLTMTAPNRFWGVFSSSADAIGPTKFKSSTEWGNRWEERVNANGKNIVVWNVQKEPPSMSLEEFKTEFNAKTEGVKKDTACTWDNQGPLYTATTARIMDLAYKAMPTTNLIVCRKATAPYFAGPKDRFFRHDFPKTYCLTEEIVAYGFI